MSNTGNVGYVLDTNPYGKEYKDILNDLAGVSEIFDAHAISQIYKESWLQIFDCLDYDFIIYGNKLQTRPMFERFVGNDLIIYEHRLCNRIREGFKKLAVEFYFTLVKFQMLEIGATYVMTKLGPDYIVICKLDTGEFHDTI
jgi:hypothetical protein